MTKVKKQSTFNRLAVYFLSVVMLVVFLVGSTNRIALGTGSRSSSNHKDDSNTISVDAKTKANVNVNLNVNSKVKASTSANSKTKANTNVKASSKATNPIVICLDPGHQKKGMKELEPIGPGSKIRKASVSSGTTGVFTKKPEYQLNLEVSLKIRKCLEELGYKVVMTRDKNEVTLSNIDRAKIANASGAAVFVRIHGDGSPSKKTNGFSVLYPSEKDVFTKKIWEQSKQIAEFVEKEMKKETAAKSIGTVPRTDLTGLNWSKIPTILVEMGFMTNVEEDKKLSEENYQLKVASGIANGIDSYIKSFDTN